jgi:3-hydroxyisobutyrate dehydrogenase-like beta-hydroxyacid dehydrogenase
MGTPMAKFLLEMYKVIVYNRTVEKALPLKYYYLDYQINDPREKGAEIAATVEEALAKADIFVH